MVGCSVSSQTAQWPWGSAGHYEQGGSPGAPIGLALLIAAGLVLAAAATAQATRLDYEALYWRPTNPDYFDAGSGREYGDNVTHPDTYPYPTKPEGGDTPYITVDHSGSFDVWETGGGNGYYYGLDGMLVYISPRPPGSTAALTLAMDRFTWDGGAGVWGSANWTGGQSPVTGANMIIDSQMVSLDSFRVGSAADNTRIIVDVSVDGSASEVFNGTLNENTSQLFDTGWVGHTVEVKLTVGEASDGWDIALDDAQFSQFSTADSDVTVAADFDSALAVTVGRYHTAGLSVEAGVTLSVENDVTVGGRGALNVNGTLAAQHVQLESGAALSGSGLVSATASPGVRVRRGATLAPGGGIARMSINGDVQFREESTFAVEVTGNSAGATAASDNVWLAGGDFDLDLSDRSNNLVVSWVEGADATSMFGGAYTVATYTGPANINGTFENVTAANFSDAYIDTVNYDVEGVVVPGGAPLGVQVVLHDQLDGDANLDGIVDLRDIVVTITNRQDAGPEATWFAGDVDFNGIVNLSDIVAIIDNWQAQAGAAGAVRGVEATRLTSSQALPEPATLFLFCGAAVPILSGLKRRRRN